MFRVASNTALQNEAAAFIARLHVKERDATVVALSGDLGAGKTTFAQGVARALGVEETVASPTFVIEKVYELRGQRWNRLVHIDAYRLKDANELGALGWGDLIAEQGNLILIEWPERVQEAIPADAIRIRFDIDGVGRMITIDGEKNGTESGKDE